MYFKYLYLLGSDNNASHSQVSFSAMFALRSDVQSAPGYGEQRLQLSGTASGSDVPPEWTGRS